MRIKKIKKNKERKDFLLRMTLLVFALSSIVLVEPAPFDLGITFLFVYGFFVNFIKFNKRITFPLIYLFIFVAANLTSMFEIPNPSYGTRYFLITIYMIVIWLFVVLFLSRYRSIGMDTIWKGYAIAGVFSVVIGLLAYFGLVPFRDTLIYSGTRIKSLFKDPNVFGPFLVPLALYAYSKIDSPLKTNKFKWFGVFSLSSIGVLLSFSRGAWGNFILAFILYIGIKFMLRPSLKTIFRMLFMGLLTFALVTFLLKIDSINFMLQQRFAYQQYDDGRFATHTFALEVIRNKPLGVGPAQYDYIYGYQPHNSYLQVAAENGWIAAFSYFAFIFASWMKAFRTFVISKNTVYLVVFASIGGLLLNAYVVDTLHWRHLWVLLALPWANINQETSIK